MPVQTKSIRQRIPATLTTPAAGSIQGRLAIVILAMFMISACSKPVEKAEDIRPVRALVVTPGSTDVVAEYPGEIRARVESRLGFRVGGKIVSRKVDAGSVVKRGQLLMQLDPQDLRLLQTQAEAGLRAADSNLALAKAELSRYQDLRQKNFVSQAVLEAKETAFRSAKATHEQAVAALRNQSNQAGYANLVSDVDGVVMNIDAEVGQVVAAGTPVVRVAQAGDMEIAVSIPENMVHAVRGFTEVKVRTWANPEKVIAGRVRELSPVADSATRTYAARVALVDAPPYVRLGMTGSVTFSARSPETAIRIPLTALVNDKNGTAVWLIENGAVRLSPVQVAGVSGNDITVASGVKSGDTVVTAGVNLLKPGQKVKLLGAEPLTPSNEKLAAVRNGTSRGPVIPTEESAASIAKSSGGNGTAIPRPPVPGATSDAAADNAAAGAAK